jgi:hypothetical protein
MALVVSGEIGTHTQPKHMLCTEVFVSIAMREGFQPTHLSCFLNGDDDDHHHMHRRNTCRARQEDNTHDLDFKSFGQRHIHKIRCRFGISTSMSLMKERKAAT